MHPDENTSRQKYICGFRDLNTGPYDLQSDALPVCAKSAYEHSLKFSILVLKNK